MPNMPEKKSRLVIWSPAAKRDLWGVLYYYARVASPETADKVVREITETGEHLAWTALIWRERNDVAPGLRAVASRPYMIFYRVDDTRVKVVRVLHERRDFSAVFKKKDA